MQRSRNRTGASSVAVLSAIGCFAILMGAIFWSSTNQKTSVTQTPQLQAVPEFAAENPQAEVPETTVQSAIVTVSNEIEAQAEDAVVVAKQEPQQLDQRQARSESIEAHLAVGEFGTAMQIAQSASDAEERTALLKQIAKAQMAAGEFQTALATIRRIPIPGERDSMRSEHAKQQSLAGGSGADFTQLIALIQSETSGPWFDDEGVGGTISEFETGVRVDPTGRLQMITRRDVGNRLKTLGSNARAADLNDDMSQPSNLRMVSLTRLEQEVAQRLADGQPVVETMKHLAGLSRIQYVFVYPEENEIVVAGPAEGWNYDENGMAVGAESGRPALNLEDLVTVLRTFSKDGMGIFGCSINPREAGLKKLKAYVEKSNARGPINSRLVRTWVKNLQKQLGLQDIVVYGVPQDSRVCRVIVEADYRMKLIGIGKLDGGSEIKSFFDLLPLNLQQSPPNLDALRWWLTMKYESVTHSPDRNVFGFEGSSVLCQSENQLVTSQGKRIQTGKSEATNRLFAEKFTQHYDELAERDLVFADMQNIFDLALVAALIRQERLDERAGWNRGAFATGGAYLPSSYKTPKTVDSVVNHKVYNGKDIVVQVAGGVRGDLLSVVKNEKLQREVPRLNNLANESRASQLPAGRWWWDAAK